MPPFGKATRRIPEAEINPDGRTLRRMEKQGTERIARALNKLRLDLFRGINDNNVMMLESRLNDKDIMQPFEDAISALVNEWALAGADFGREQIERTIYGIRR